MKSLQSLKDDAWKIANTKEFPYRKLTWLYEHGLYAIRGIMKGEYIVVSYKTKKIVWKGNIF